MVGSTAGVTITPALTASTVNIINNGYGVRLEGIQYGNSNMDHFLIYMGGVATFRMMRDRNNGYIGTLMSGVWYNLSDDRLKHNEADISNALTTIRQLNPQTYNKSPSLTDSSNTYLDAGFIAQEVYEIPELSSYVSVGDDTEVWSLDYTPIFTYAVAGLKELDVIVTTQASIISSLEAKLSALEARLKLAGI